MILCFTRKQGEHIPQYPPLLIEPIKVIPVLELTTKRIIER